MEVKPRLSGVLLVFGGRDFGLRAGEPAFLTACLDRVAQRMGITAIRHGAARGADTLASKWGLANGVPVEPFPADWRAYGKAAGHLRNAAMLAARPPVVAAVGFPGGAGTADMAARCEAAGVPLWRPSWR